jgi:iron-sulfur cluster assembly protein
MNPSEINYKIGNEKLVKVTEPASTKLNSLLTKQGRPQGALRVAVIGGGCSGLQYKMDLVDGPANRDIMVESQGCGWSSIEERALRERFVLDLQR